MIKPQLTKSEIVNKFFPIYFYRRHLDIACRDILGLNLAPHHAIVLRAWGLGVHYNLLMASRGTGKSVLIAIYYTLMALLYPRNKLMIVAPGFRQSKMVLLEVEKIILCRLSSQKDVEYSRASLQDPKKVINKDPSFWTVNFTNGSVIYAVPLGSDGDTIRGLRAFMIAQDESFLLPSNITESVLNPMLNVMFDPTKVKSEQAIKSQSIKTSTIDYSFRDFYKEFFHYKAILEKGIEGVLDGKSVSPKDITVFEFNFEDSFYTNEKGEQKLLWGMDWERIYEKRSNPNTNIEVWEAENKNIAADISGGYFSFYDLEACEQICIDEKLDLYPEALDSCSGQCILGIDTAPSSANSAFVVIKVGSLNSDDRDVSLCETADGGSPCPYLGKSKNCLLRSKNAILYAQEENKMPQKDRVSLIYDLRNRYNITSIAMDARGGGYELADLLKDEKYIKNIIDEKAQIIYDPSVVSYLSVGNPILKLYITTQNINMIYNAYLKALLSNKQLLIPRPLRGRLDNKRLYESCGHIETLINQLVRIKAFPAGSSLKFEIETVDPQTGRKMNANKDLYSALVYAVGRLRDLLEDKEMNRGKEYDLALPKGFNI